MVHILPTKSYLEQRTREQQAAKKIIDTEIKDILLTFELMEETLELTVLFKDRLQSVVDFRRQLLATIESRCYNADGTVKDEYVEIAKRKDGFYGDVFSNEP